MLTVKLTKTRLADPQEQAVVESYPFRYKKNPQESR